MNPKKQVKRYPASQIISQWKLTWQLNFIIFIALAQTSIQKISATVEKKETETHVVLVDTITLRATWQHSVQLKMNQPCIKQVHLWAQKHTGLCMYAQGWTRWHELSLRKFSSVGRDDKTVVYNENMADMQSLIQIYQKHRMKTTSICMYTAFFFLNTKILHLFILSMWISENNLRNSLLPSYGSQRGKSGHEAWRQTLLTC